jgi:hypothetical protein
MRMMTLPSDTFKYVPVGLLPMPGTCATCGSNQRGCVDFGITVEYFGALLICESCIIDITNVEQLGLMTRKEAAAIVEQNDLFVLRDREMVSAREDLRNALVAAADSLDGRVLSTTTSVELDTTSTNQNLPYAFDFLATDDEPSDTHG